MVYLVCAVDHRGDLFCEQLIIRDSDAVFLPLWFTGLDYNAVLNIDWFSGRELLVHFDYLF